MLFQEKEKINQGIIESNVEIKGDIIVGKGSVIKSGAYLEGLVYIGENCVVGPNCFIHGVTSIGKIGTALL